VEPEISKGGFSRGVSTVAITGEVGRNNVHSLMSFKSFVTIE
jgi:hypothetical protein